MPSLRVRTRSLPTLLSSILLLSFTMAVAFAAPDLGNLRPEKPAGGNPVPPPAPTPAPAAATDRIGGDNWTNATPIASLPFSDTGNTCGYVNDAGYDCPYIDNMAPDVFYVYQPAANESIDLDLCNSLYDCLLLVWEDTYENVVACNDDAGCGYSGYQSHLSDVALQAGHTYYIVVDGYGTECGEYVLNVTPRLPCVTECPPGAIDEGEIPCPGNPVDTYNGGCQGAGWTEIPAQADGCATLCGRSCTFVSQGLSYRDTDWFSVTAAGGVLAATCIADFRVRLFLVYTTTDCADLQYVTTDAFECAPAHLEYTCQPGQEIWPWVAPNWYSGVPDGRYILELCGLEPPVPVPTQVATWGRIKRLFR